VFQIWRAGAATRGNTGGGGRGEEKCPTVGKVGEERETLNLEAPRVPNAK
jgi:hypothetical protein